jgi:hypothetical protein
MLNDPGAVVRLLSSRTSAGERLGVVIGDR